MPPTSEPCRPEEDELASLYAAADVYVDSSLRDGEPLTQAALRLLCAVPGSYVTRLLPLITPSPPTAPTFTFHHTHCTAAMNLAPLEFVSTREAFGMPATAIVSEFAGVAQLLEGSLLCNPHDSDGLSAVLETAAGLAAADTPETLAERARVRCRHRFSCC